MAGTITLSIVGALVALLTLLLFLKVSLIISYDEGAKLTLKVLFVRKTLYPKKKKKHHKKSMSAKKAQRVKDKLERKKAKKKEKKQEKKGSGKSKKSSVSDIMDTVGTVSILVREIVSRFTKYIRIKIAKIHIKIATGDAAHTAIAYGALTQSINVLFPLLEDVKNFNMPKNQDIDISPDFLSEDSEIELKLVFSIRVWQALVTALAALKRLTIYSIKKLEKQERKKAKKARKEAKKNGN